jgi:hypothetical protein
MKKITLFLFALFTCWQINAQVSAYSFSETTETYAQITGTTSTATGDDGTQTNIPIGFTFNYGGINYTAFGISTNGIIRLGSNATDTAIATGWTNGLSNTAGNRPLIAALWDDNHLGAGTIRYAVTGSSPNQVLTVNFHNTKIGGGGTNGGADVSTIIRLYETTNVIEIVYSNPFTTVNAVSASVGLNDASSFLSVTPAATSTVSSATANNAIDAATMANLAGKKLTFSPPSCFAPSGFVASNLTLTTATISWNAANPVPSTGYEYYYSTVNTAPSGAGTPINALTDNLSGLAPNTTHYVWLRSDCGGTFSTWVGPFTFFTGYCIPSSTSSSSYVDNFTTSGGSQNISNLASGFTAGGYLNASAQVVESYETGSFDFNATIVGGTVGFAIWIDWNNNLIFEAGEKVYNTTAYGNGPFSGTITVPGGTALGNYRMRITTDWNASNPNNPCAAAARAEFEDYTVTVSNPPACLVPNTIIASNITSNSVDLSWTDGSGGLQFDYEYVIQAPGTGEPTVAGAQVGDVTVIGEGFDINGDPLTPNTTYEVYVRSDCGGTFSTWAGPITFRTLCTAIDAFPFVETFNTDSTTESCWLVVNGNADGDQWNMNGTTIPRNGQAAELYTDFNTVNNDYLVSPQLDLGTTAKRLKFWVRHNSNFEPDNLNVRISTTGRDIPSFASNLLLTLTTTQITTTYTEYIVDLSAYSGLVYIAFAREDAPADGWYVSIDDVTVEDAPTAPPTCATNVVATPHPTCGNYANSITWDVTSGADGYYVTIGTTTGGNDIANAVSVSGTSYNFTGNFNTTYFYTIVPFNANGSASGCTEQSFATNVNGCYCVSAPTSVDNLGITNVQIVSTNFANTVSTSPVYNDHTATPVDMTQGINNNVQITFNVPSFGSNSYDYNTVIWIDANDDYVLDASEIVYTGLSATTAAPTLLNASFVMPGTMPLGQHRMRIVATDALQTPANPCYSGTYGETADFTVNIVAASCTPPAATTALVPACGTAEYSIDVNVTALGSGTPSITDGTTSWPVSAIGVVNVGPFASGSSVTLTLLHGSDTTCDLPLGSFNYACPPANDNCANAVSLTVNPDFSCGTVTAGTTQSATDSGIEPTFTVTGTPDNDVWYSFVATGTAHRISLLNVVAVTGFSTDMGIAVFDGTGTCSALTLVGSSDPETYNLTGLTPGTTYYVAVYGWGAAPGAVANFNICVGTPPAPPANDECANAIAISSMPYSNTQDASAATGPVVSTCTGMNDGVWYTVVGNGADIIIDVTAVTGWDPELGIYTGSCGTFTCVDSIDDEGTSVGETYTIVASTLGTTYYINVGHYSGSGDSPEGPFTIDVTTTLSSDSFDNANFTAYPNPVKDVLNVSYTSEISSIRVINMIGQEVISKNINATSTQVDMSQLSAGTYIVNVTVGDNVKTLKVVKQ